MNQQQVTIDVPYAAHVVEEDFHCCAHICGITLSVVAAICGLIFGILALTHHHTDIGVIILVLTLLGITEIVAGLVGIIIGAIMDCCIGCCLD